MLWWSLVRRCGAHEPAALSQRDLEALSGVDQTAISRMERGLVPGMRLEKFARVAHRAGRHTCWSSDPPEPDRRIVPMHPAVVAATAARRRWSLRDASLDSRKREAHADVGEDDAEPGGASQRRANGHESARTTAPMLRLLRTLDQSLRCLGHDEVLARRDAQDGRAHRRSRTARGPRRTRRSPMGATPRTPRRPTMDARSVPACSPMPPVNTSASSRGSAVAAAAMPAAARDANISSASMRAFVARAGRRRRARRTSALTPDTPSRPDWCSSASDSWATVSRPSPRSRTRTPGSMEPERVLIIRPSSGV